MISRRGLLLGSAAAGAALLATPTEAVAYASPSPITVPLGAQLTYGVVGDSITGRGSFASDPSLAWTQLLQTRLEQSWQVTRVNGVTHTDAEGLTCLGTVDQVPTGCDLVVVGLGTNDCREQVGGSYVYSQTQTYAAAQTLFANVLAANPGATIVALGVWGDATIGWVQPGSTTPVSRAARWDGLIGERAVENGALHVPVADLFGYSSFRLPANQPAFGGYTTDGFHPNDSGHAAIEARVAKYLRLV